MVREFYANLCGEQDGKVFVRDQWVPFDRKVINEHYKPLEENHDQFKSLCNNSNYDMILGHPALIFELCKTTGVQFTHLEEKIEPLIGITVRKDESHND